MIYVGYILLGIIALLMVLRVYMAMPHTVIREVKSIPDVGDDVKELIFTCFKKARKADRKTWVYDFTAPIVMLFVVPFLKREAERLPKAFRKWDNNVSLNGDGNGWQDPDTGEWFDTRTKKAPEGVRLYSHQDLDYYGPVYYGWKVFQHLGPRHWINRYVWVGLRNRASKLSLDLGCKVEGEIKLISGDFTIGRRKHDGYFLLRNGDNFHYKSFKTAGPIVIIRSYGYKLEIAKNNFKESNQSAAVAIGFSFKGK